MTKKLTGREAVIALMEGKTIRVMVKRTPVTEKSEVWDLNYLTTLKEEQVEIVPEPMVWEGELLADMDYHGDEACVEIPRSFLSKRVKVRIEEIL